LLLGAIAVIHRPEVVMRPFRRLAATAPARHLALLYNRQMHPLLERVRPGGAFWLVLTVQLTVLVAAGAAFSDLTEDVLENEVAGVDDQATRFIVQRREPWLTTSMLAITWLGDAAVLIPVALAVGLYATHRLRTRRPLVLLALGLAGSAVLVQLIKFLVARPRPDEGLVTALGYSFPSGHSTAAAAGWGTLALVLFGLTRRWGTRVAMTAGTVAVVLLVGTSRVYLGVHEPTDVLGGWVLGVGWVAAVTTSLHVYSARRNRTRRGQDPSVTSR
jgi:undecaprenyl-diphosphatase